MANLRKVFLLILSTIALISSHSFGQSKQLKIPKNDFWYKYNKQKLEKLYLTDLTKSTTDSHWRLWYNGQTVSYAIDIVNDADKITAFVTPYTEEFVPYENEPQTDRIYTYKIPLEDSIAKNILQLINKTNINQIPDEDDIEGWGHGFDGVTYCIENATRSDYSFKSYWSPDASETKEAKTIKDFIGKIEEIVSIKKVWLKFNKYIPFESYNTGGPMVPVRALTYDQLLYYKQDRASYRKKMTKRNN